MPLPFIRRARHDAQIAGLQAERDRANKEKRQIGAALSEALRERDYLLAHLRGATVRDGRGRMTMWINTDAGRAWAARVVSNG